MSTLTKPAIPRSYGKRRSTRARTEFAARTAAHMTSGFVPVAGNPPRHRRPDTVSWLAAKHAAAAEDARFPWGHFWAVFTMLTAGFLTVVMIGAQR